MRQLRVYVRGHWYTVEVGDVWRSPVEVVVEGERYLVEVGGPTGRPVPTAVRPSPPQEAREAPGLRGIIQSGERVVRCPMPGRIVAVCLEAGQEAQAGDEVCVLEAMKMEQSVRLSQSGTVKAVLVRAGDTVQAGGPLIELA